MEDELKKKITVKDILKKSIRGVQNVSNIDSHLALWFFPLFSTIINSTKNFRHLAYQEHPPLVTTFWTQKYKGFSKFIKENIFRPSFF